MKWVAQDVDAALTLYSACASLRSEARHPLFSVRPASSCLCILRTTETGSKGTSVALPGAGGKELAGADHRAGYVSDGVSLLYLPRIWDPKYKGPWFLRKPRVKETEESSS